MARIFLYYQEQKGKTVSDGVKDAAQEAKETAGGILSDPREAAQKATRT